ncbi:MAG: 7-cyano-7-deazaguanine synthase [Phycisphaerales bacterium]|nr:7-cyano-7-deazaguanine synthase [Phycisphaerales bacterium]
MNDDRPALIIHHGSIPGLVAAWAEGVVRTSGKASDDLQRSMAYFPNDDRPARTLRRDAVQRHVELCRLAGVSERQMVRCDAPAAGIAGLSETLVTGAKQSAMLISAVLEAATLGLSRVVWPIHAGASQEIDIAQLADICDRAMLVSQLIGLDTMRSSERSMAIQTPYADLNDAQLMELALDMDVPLQNAWWCLNEQPTPCGHCSSCMRWREALRAVDPASTLDIHVLTGPGGAMKQKQTT